MADDETKGYSSLDDDMEEADPPLSSAVSGGGEVSDEVRQELAEAAAKERERLLTEEEA